MSYLDICRAQLPMDEGRRKRAYQDSLGIWSGGIGRNLQDVEFSDSEIALMFANDLDRAEITAKVLFPSFDKLSDNRKAALVNLAFNMGERLAGFHHMREAVAQEDFNEAANQLTDSLWAKQVQASRSERIIKMIREG